MNPRNRSLLLLSALTGLASTAFSEDKPAQPPRPEVKTFLDHIELKDGDSFVFLGDSITHQCLYTQYLEDYFYTRQPNERVHFHNAGINGDTGGDALERFDDDVVPYKPKYVTTLIGMNDGGYRDFNLDFFNTFQHNMRGLMDRIAGIGAQAIVMTPTMYDSRSRRLFGDPAEPRDTYYNGVLALYGAWTREQADVRGLGFVDMYSALNNATFHERKRTAKWSMIHDSFHPEATGQCVMACAIIRDAVQKSVVSDISLYPTNGKWESNAENAAVSDMVQKENAIAFTVLENALPWVLPADADEGVRVTNLNALYNKERLAVSGLNSGVYVLKIDGTTIGRWTEVQLAAGIELQGNSNTPQHQQATKIAELNKKRNDQFYRPSRSEFQQIKGKRQELHHAEFDKAADLEDKKAALEKCRAEVKAKVAEMLKGAAEIEDQIYAANKPKPHRYELALSLSSAPAGEVLAPDQFKSYVETFNADDNELYKNYIPNAGAWAFLKANIPFFECAEKELEKTYYFRWWTYRKHLRESPDGLSSPSFCRRFPGRERTTRSAARRDITPTRDAG